MNPWEANALQYNFQEDAETRTTLPDGAATTAIAATGIAVAPQDYVHDTVIYPGLYAPSGFDMMSILVRVTMRQNPTVELGAVDASCALLMCDLLQPDYPAVYASEAFEALTGYTQQEILGRNCRFLQAPPPPPPTSHHHRHHHHHHHHPQHPQQRHGGSRSNSGGSNSSRSSSSTRRHAATSNSNGGGGGGSSSSSNNSNMKSIRQQMRRAIETNTELVVEVPNFRKDGRPFVNVLTMIPVCWDGCGEAPRYSVGFQAEKTW